MTSSASSPGGKEKSFLNRREFLTDDKEDRTVVQSVVRKYDYGAFMAQFTVTGGNTFSGSGNVLDIYCNPEDPESVKRAMDKLRSLEDEIKMFRDAVKKAAGKK